MDSGLPVGHKGLDGLEHVQGRLVDLHEDSAVQLSESEELEDFSGLGGQFIDTWKDRLEKKWKGIPSDSDHENHLGLGRNVKRAFGLGLEKLN